MYRDHRRTMLLPMYIVLAAIGVFMSWFALTNNTVEGSPVPETSEYASEHDFDFGMLWVGEHFEHRFALVNRAGRSLRIHSVQTSCSCTVAEVPPEIPPGGTVLIPVKLNSSKSSGGPFRSEVKITTDNGVVVYTLRGIISTRVAPRIEVGNVKRGGEPIEITVLNRSGRSDRIISVESDATLFEPTFLARPGNRWCNVVEVICSSKRSTRRISIGSIDLAGRHRYASL